VSKKKKFQLNPIFRKQYPVDHTTVVIKEVVELIDAITVECVVAPRCSQSKIPEPPRWAECLLVVCTGSAKRAEVIHGDLCERFGRDCATMTPKRARLLFRARVLASVLPLLGRTIGRMVKWTAIISAAKRLFIG
jgi:hypothetical protein